MKKEKENTENTENTEKKVYSVKERYYLDLIGVHQRALQYLKNIATDFLELSLGAMTVRDLEEISRNEFTNIKIRFYDNVDAEITAVKNPILRANITAGVSETYNDFERKTRDNILKFVFTSDYLGQQYPLQIDHYSVTAGDVVFSVKNMEYLKEKYATVYIDTPEKEHFAQLMEQTFKGLTELKAILVKNNVGVLFAIPGDLGLFDEGREDVIIAAPDWIEYIEQ